MNEGRPGKRTAGELSGDDLRVHTLLQGLGWLWLFHSGEHPLPQFSTLYSGHSDPKPPLPPAKADSVLVPLDVRAELQGCSWEELGIVCFVG